MGICGDCWHKSNGRCAKNPPTTHVVSGGFLRGPKTVTEQPSVDHFDSCGEFLSWSDEWDRRNKK